MAAHRERQRIEHVACASDEGSDLSRLMGGQEPGRRCSSTAVLTTVSRRGPVKRMPAEKIILLFGLLIIGHFIADFLLQSHEMARRKSIEVGVLVQHVSIHLIVTFFMSVLVVGHIRAVLIALFVAGAHAAIDWNVWRGYRARVAKREDARTFEWWNDHWFYVTLGADQLAHGLTFVIAVALMELLR